MPWGVLIASCAVGLGVSLAAHQFADSLQQPAGITLTVRAAFVPVVAGITFLAAEPHRPLTASLPAPAWLTTAVHLALALPLLILTAWIQLLLAAADLAAIRQSQHLAAQLPWTALGTELAAWSALAATAAVLVARTRWSDLGGAIAAPAALAFIALLALTPWHLLPATFTGLTARQRSAWLQAEWSWWALGLLAAGLACLASRDSWLRFAPPLRGSAGVRTPARRSPARRLPPSL